MLQSTEPSGGRQGGRLELVELQLDPEGGSDAMTGTYVHTHSRGSCK